MKLWHKISFHPLFIFVILISFLTGYIKYLFGIFIIVIIHELGHVFFATIFKRQITRIVLYPFGGLTKMNSAISSFVFEDLLIASGGIFFQTILGFFILELHILNLISDNVYIFISTYNTSIMLFNMLPIVPLDGYKIIKLFSDLLVPFKYTFYMTIPISFLFMVYLISTNYNLFRDNILLFSFLIYTLIREIGNIKYMLSRFYMERIYRDFNYPIKKINNYKYMYKNKVHLIKNTHEKIYLRELFFHKLY